MARENISLHTVHAAARENLVLYGCCQIAREKYMLYAEKIFYLLYTVARAVCSGHRKYFITRLSFARMPVRRYYYTCICYTLWPVKKLLLLLQECELAIVHLVHLPEQILYYYVVAKARLPEKKL